MTQAVDRDTWPTMTWHGSSAMPRPAAARDWKPKPRGPRQRPTPQRGPRRCRPGLAGLRAATPATGREKGRGLRAGRRTHWDALGPTHSLQRTSSVSHSVQTTWTAGRENEPNGKQNEKKITLGAEAARLHPAPAAGLAERRLHAGVTCRAVPCVSLCAQPG